MDDFNAEFLNQITKLGFFTVPTVVWK